MDERHESERTEIGGIPVFWREAPPPFAAALVFRVGRIDETLATSGITHLVEHLAMFTLADARLPGNALVDTTRAIFYANGEPAEVAAFLERVCAGLRELPLGRVEGEKRVLLTEAASSGGGPVGHLFALRYGARGPGLHGYHELGLRRLTADDVEAWARHRFTRGNAALWCTGPPPEELRLELPPGERLPPPEPQPLPDFDPPAHAPVAAGGVSTSFVGTRATTLTTSTSIAAQRAHRRLRLERSLTYDVGSTYEPLTATLAHVTLGADSLEQHAADVQTELLRDLEELASTGPTHEELEQSVADALKLLGDPLATAAQLDVAVANELFGARQLTRAELASELEALTPGSVAAAFSGVFESRIVLAPPGTPRPHGHSAYGEAAHTPVEGRRHRASAERPWRKAAAIASAPEGVSLLPPGGGEVITIRYEELVGLLRRPDGRLTLLALDGSSIEFDPAGIRRGAELAAEIEERVTPELVIPLEDDGRAAVEEVARRCLESGSAIDAAIAQLPAVLAPGEDLLLVAEGMRRLKWGLLGLTDRRLFFYGLGIRESARELREFPFETIESISSEKGWSPLGDAKLHVTSGGECVTYSEVKPRERALDLELEVRERQARSAAWSAEGHS